MATLRPIKNSILFQFEDKTVRKSDMGRNRSQFAETTEWGFEISSYDESAKTPRWGRVKFVGDEVDEDIKVGSRILVEALQWTEGMKFEDETYWRTNDTKVLIVDEDYQP